MDFHWFRHKKWLVKRLVITWFMLMLVLPQGFVLAATAGDPEEGEDVFAGECSDCHSLRQGKNKKGPSLFGIIGRKSAMISDFSYSDAMKAKNTVWTIENIDAYITHPKVVVPKGKMKYDGLPDAKDRADLLAYFATKK